MDRPPCFECGEPSDHDHHVVPKVMGGTNTVPLCAPCHAKVHSLKRMATAHLTKLGLERAKARGVVLGAARKGAYRLGREDQKKGLAKLRERRAEDTTKKYADIIPVVVELHRDGVSLRQIGKKLAAQGILSKNGRPWAASMIRWLINHVAPLCESRNNPDPGDSPGLN